MKRHLAADDQAADIESMSREIAVLRAELDQRRQSDDERARFDDVSNALVGELDPTAVLERAERWATAALGRPCSIVTEPPPGGDGLPLGGGNPTAWLMVSGPSLGETDDDAAVAVVDRITRALDAAERVAALT